MYKTKIYAHRGASQEAPENTMEAFRLAYDIGVDGIEFDVQMSKDGELVIIHDETIDRTSNGQGLVQDYTLDELLSFDFGYSFKINSKNSKNNKNNKNNKNSKNSKNSENSKKQSNYNEQYKIPLLKDVLKAFQNTNLLFNIELKNNIINYVELEEKALQLTKEFNVLDRTIFSSFSHKSMVKMLELDSEIDVAFLYADGLMNPTKYLNEYNINIAHPVFHMCQNEEDLNEYHTADKKVNVWTVDSGKLIRKLCDIGVDGIITNRPRLGMEIKGDIS